MKQQILNAKYIINPETGFNFYRHTRFTVTTEAHSHEGFAEIFLVTMGESGHNLNGVDGIIHKNMLFFIKPQDTHYYFRTAASVQTYPLELLNLAFPYSTLNQALEYLEMPELRNKLLDSTQSIYVELTSEQEMNLAQSLLDAGLCVSSYPKIAACKFRQSLIGLLNCFNSPEATLGGSAAPKWLKSLCAEFEDGLNFKKGLDFLVRKSGYSHEYLCRIFKTYKGVTPSNYVNSLKLDYVASMLVVSDEQISSVAFNAGFENLSHFNHLFRKHYGVSPACYRKTRSYHS